MSQTVNSKGDTLTTDAQGNKLTYKVGSSGATWNYKNKNYVHEPNTPLDRTNAAARRTAGNPSNTDWAKMRAGSSSQTTNRVGDTVSRDVKGNKLTYRVGSSGALWDYKNKKYIHEPTKPKSPLNLAAMAKNRLRNSYGSNTAGS